MHRRRSYIEDNYRGKEAADIRSIGREAGSALCVKGCGDSRRLSGTADTGAGRICSAVWHGAGSRTVLCCRQNRTGRKPHGSPAGTCPRCQRQSGHHRRGCHAGRRSGSGQEQGISYGYHFSGRACAADGQKAGFRRAGAWRCRTLPAAGLQCEKRLRCLHRITGDARLRTVLLRSI